MKDFKKCEIALGLDKVQDKLAEFLVCEDAKRLMYEEKLQTDLNTARENLNKTNDALMFYLRFGTPTFSGLDNIEGPLLRARNGGLLNYKELLKIADVLFVFNSIKNWRNKSEGVKSCIDYLFDKLYFNKYLEDKIKSIIISEDSMADDASPELYSIRKRIVSSSNKIRDRLDKLLRSRQKQKYLQDSLVTIREGRFVIPVKSEHRKEIQGLIHDSSASGATVFIEPLEVVEANNEIRLLKSKEKEEIEKILKEMSSEIGGFADNILRGYQIALKLNVLFGKAELAYKMNAVVPRLNAEGRIKLKQARHPLIDKKYVVATDIELGINFNTLIITGPNTGGKTVSLKTVGLLTLMVMKGLMIPAQESSELSIFENILVDIGDEQSIEQSLSTFSSHMKNIKNILDLANESTLVLLDELGAGTDPTEGAALAMSIIETLREKGAKIAATTHYSELKSYAISTKGVENASCEFNVKTLSPTYKLLIGVPGKSNAFAISSRLGISEDIINRAKDFISKENERLEDVISKLEEDRSELEQEKAEIEQLKKETALLRDKAKAAKESAEAAYKRDIKEAKEKALSIVSRTKAQSESLIGELEQLKKKKDFSEKDLIKLKSKLKQIEDSADPVEHKENSGYKLPRELKVGDSVLIFDINKKGTVIDVSKGAKEVTVQAGIIKTRVPIDNIRLLKEQPAKINSSFGKVTKTIGSIANKSIKREIDLRGKTVMEAIIELDKFIDSAVLSKVNELTIIHGKGTGVLRKEIGAYLKKHPSVKSHRLGVYGEGETGVTIVELR